MEFKLVTSNEFKLKEFQRFGIDNLLIEKGRDLKEVEADAYTVALYKAIEAGVGRIIEDTSLEVEGEDIGVNIRWLLDHLDAYSGKKAIWKVLLGFNDGHSISLFKGVTEGIILKRFDELKGFGFDSLFVPNGSDLTLYELEEKGQKDEFSARKRAVLSFLRDERVLSKTISDIPVWQGQYQHE